jgi:hypothetical protein
MVYGVWTIDVIKDPSTVNHLPLTIHHLPKPLCPNFAPWI